MTGESYFSILKENLVESSQKMNVSRFIFQQDNNPKHTSRVVKRFFSGEYRGSSRMAQSLDINPIEHLWYIFVTKIAYSVRKNTATFWEALQREWELINPTVLANLVKSIPKRLKVVIENKGGNKDY